MSNLITIRQCELKTYSKKFAAGGGGVGKMAGDGTPLLNPPLIMANSVKGMKKISGIFSIMSPRPSQVKVNFKISQPKTNFFSS